jgi:hypothetical protein
LNSIYYSPENPGSFSTVHRLWLAADKKIPKKYVENFLESQKTFTVNKITRQKFKRRGYEINNIGDLLQIDLIDFSNISKYNDNYKFILICIDCFSKYVWMEKLKNKTASECLNALKKILKNNVCRKLNSDSGKEFVNRTFQEYLRKKNIIFFQNVDDGTHAAIVERAIRTIKTRLYKYMYFKNTLRYVNVYKKICKAYNSSYHRVIGMAPADVRDSNIVEVYRNTHRNDLVDKTNSKLGKLRVNDFVRISKRKSAFQKGSKGQGFTEEIFRIVKVISHTPTMYELQDFLKEPIKGKFYRFELSKVQIDPESFEVDKILRRQKKQGIPYCLVTRKGWPQSFSVWVKQSDIIN